MFFQFTRLIFMAKDEMSWAHALISFGVSGHSLEAVYIVIILFMVP